MTETPKPLYPRDLHPVELEPHYSRHVSAMTTEQLHHKSDIAEQFAWRDQVIEQLRARVGELEAEVRRVRDLINVDRTGLAATLNHTRAIVSGYSWIPAGEWGSYDYTQRSEETLRAEVGYLIQSVTGSLDRGLDASGKRADSAHREGPTVPLGPTRGELEARITDLESQLAAVRNLIALFDGDGGHAQAGEALAESCKRAERYVRELAAAQSKAEQYERDWYDAKSEFGTARAKDAVRIRELEARILELEAK